MHRIEQPSRGHQIFLMAALATFMLLGQAGIAMAQWATNGNNINNTNTGNVGIGVGTESPQSKLQIGSRTGTSTPAPDSLSLGATFSSSAAQNLKLKLYDDATYIYGMSVSSGQQEYVVPLTSSKHVFYAGTSPLMAIKGTGEVGIGTTAPKALLEINKSQNAETTIILDNSYNVPGTTTARNAAFTGFWFRQGTVNGATNNRFFFGSINDGNNSQNGGPGAVQFWNFANGPMLFATNNVEHMRIDAAGNVSVTGDITATGNIAAKYQDVAEWVPAAHALPAGTVVVLNPEKSNQVLASSQAYDTKVAGVVSAQPGIVLGEGGEGKVLVATTGRVKVKVDATNAPIHIGDLLVTSDKEGVAMKSEPILIGSRQIHAPGTLIGKALEPLEKGTGEILVLLSLQ